ncbi:DUF2179 domain-containing protein [Papillibacter cinnamivorans]|uniref:Uncharacterized protein YebE, UPF0316 family n=1 Tax=Papillibacter cinnamivorans DSM 12816 TaxID=1122930 RepID=A0A1W1ZI53_9FIRM|nr:DUF5698 domain-containing protein [Papillibacter cinnamivorans]SMC48046.1 Uncharacterized protein YebE, UPF0316 family [Papillibacter cinnamivorans DSM 12816]
MAELLQEGGVWLYVFIFVGKILEVSVSTVRLVLINRGERVRGAAIAFVEILLWLAVTGTVLAGFQSDWIRVLVFAAAFAIGNYVGSWVEDRLAFGLCSIQVIVPDCVESLDIATRLRENKFAVTVLQGQGKDGPRELMLLHIKRKRIPQAVQIIRSELDTAVITVNDSKILHGGFIGK